MPSRVDAVHESADTRIAADYLVRSIATPAEFEGCAALQVAIWGERFSECIPAGFLKVAQRYGGTVLGAFRPDGTLCGFVFGFTGLEAGVPVHWSDMLAVLPEDRGTGLGRRLKLAQRMAVLALGITRMRWSFDPLESRNAYLNFSRLGVMAEQYEVNMYGDTDSPLHEGIGTDRLIALWELDSDRVRDRVELGACPPGREILTGAVPVHRPRELGGALHPGEPELGLDAPRLTVAIPTSIQEVRATSPHSAVAWRRVTAAALGSYLGRGWRITELVRDDAVSHYLLER